MQKGCCLFVAAACCSCNSVGLATLKLPRECRIITKKKLNLIQIELALPHTDAQAEQKK